MYTTASGIQIPQGTDAFSPTSQFKTWADGEAAFDNFLNVDLDSERTALTAPKLRDGVYCWVRSTKQLWRYVGTTWKRVGDTFQYGDTTALKGSVPQPTTDKIRQEFTAIGTGSGGGDGTILVAFPTPFLNGITYLSAVAGDTTNVGYAVLVLGDTTLSIGKWKIYLPGGGLLGAGAACRVNVTAVGW